MRTILTIVAVALVAVMSVALVAPYLIDWSSQRGEIESRLSAVTGANVSLNGPVELRLLPTPYLALGEGVVSAPGQDGANLTFASARLELALVKLPSGQIRFSDIRLEKPVLTLTRGPDGALKLPPLRMAGLHSTGFDRLSVRNGRVKVIGATAGAEISGVEIDAAAPLLDGPAHLNGQFSGPDNAPVAFRLASEKPGPDGTPLRLAVDAGPGWPAAEFEGALEGDPTAGLGGLRFAGAATLTGTAPGEDGPTPWRVAGPLTADLDQAEFRQAEFRLGPEERGIRADGDAKLIFGSPAQISVALKAKQVNVDSLMRRKGEDGVAPARAVALIARMLSAALKGRENEAAIDAQISAQPIILGAQTLPDASATLKAAAGAPLSLSFNLGLPEQSRLRVGGDLETGARPRFRGDVAFSSADFALLRDWAVLGAPPALANVAASADALPYRNVSLSGAVEASPAGFSGRNLKLTLDRSTLTGAVAFKGPDGGGPAGRLDVDLASDSLDVDGLPGLAAGSLIGGLDLSLSLRAGSLHIARIGETQIDSGSLALNVTKTGPNVTLKRLSVAGLDGASFDIEGALGPDSTAATGHLRADRLHDFAVLVSRMAPNDWSRMLVERAAELSPAALTFGAQGGAADPNGVPTVDSLKANGSAGETQFSVTLDPRPNDPGRALTVSLDSPNSGALLRQLGVHTPTSGGGHARIAINATGGWEKGYDVDATSQLAGAELTWRGRFLPAAASDDAKLFGSAKAKSPNLAPLAVALGLAPANGGALGPADIGFDATLRGDRWSFSRLAATIAGVKGAGELTLQPAKPIEVTPEAGADIARAEEAVGPGTAPAKPPASAPAEIEGQLTVERMPLSGALALALGPPQPGRTAARWSDVRFAPAPLRPPSAAVKLRVGTLDLAEALTARDFTTTLRVDKGRLDLDDFAMKIAGGSASGRATLRRDADNVTLAGALALDSVALDRTGFSGRIGAALDFVSTGRSPAALINGLAGSGTVTFAGAALARNDPAALDRVVAKSQVADAPLDETNIAFALGNELNRAPLAIPDGSAPVSLSAGVMKIGPIKVPEGQGTLSADLDLRTLATQARFTLASSASGLKFWSGPPPSAAVTVDNALDAPKRQTDVSALSAALAAQAIARESDRISTLEADIRERAFFNRRLKGERFMDRRQQEIQDWESEQSRLKGQFDRLRSLEEMEKAAEAARRAAEDAADKATASKPGEKGAADGADGAKDGAGGQAPTAPFAPAPAPKSDQVGANAPNPAAPTPPPRPKARPTQVDPEPGKLY